MASEQVQRVLDQAEALDAIRRPHEAIWDELASICFPRHGVLSSHRVAPPTSSTNDRHRIASNFDGTAMRACDTLATGQSARITPMGSRWFVLRPPARLKESQAALNWYAACTETLIAALGASNFYNRAFQCYQYRGGHGCAAMEVTAGKNNQGLHFRTYPTGSYAIAENSLDEVDTVYRRHFRTPAQLVEMFGEEALPTLIRKLASDTQTRHKPSEEVIHAVFPREKRDPRLKDGKSKPFASVHVHVGAEALLMESGFDSMPVAVSRWQTSAISPYGWGPADYALPEAAQANFQEQMLDTLAETAAFPRVLYPAGMKDELDFSAMGLTPFDPAAGEHAVPREWLTGGRYDIGKDRAQDKRRAIEAAFFVELFNAVSRMPADTTATHISALVSESRELFHPIFSNMVREWQVPILRRGWQILMEQGRMPEPPREVIESDDLGPFIEDPDVEFVSAMAMALEQSHIAGLNEIVAVVSPLASLDPAWLRALNPDTIVPHLVRSKGLPTIYLRSEEQLQELAQQEAAAREMQAAEIASQTVRNVGGVDEAAKAAQMLQG